MSRFLRWLSWPLFRAAAWVAEELHAHRCALRMRRREPVQDHLWQHSFEMAMRNPSPPGSRGK